MKRYALTSIILLFISVLVGQVDRAYNSVSAIKPFLISDYETTIGWYTDYLCDLCSFSFLMAAVIVILKPISVHFFTEEIHSWLYGFVKMWHRVFWVIFVTSLLDIVHFIIAARQIEWFFLAQNGIFLLMTGFFIYKLYRR